MLFEPLRSPELPSPFELLRNVQAELARRMAAERSTPMAFALYTRDGGVLLRTPLPSVEAKDISVEVDGNVLTLSGQFAEDPEAERAAAVHRERPRGKFARSLHLSFEIDAARVAARLERGVLEIEVPRLEKNSPVKIPVLSPATRN